MKKQAHKYPCPDGVHSLEEGRWTLNHRCTREEIIGWKEISGPEERKCRQKIEIRSAWRGRNGSQQNGQGT